MLNLSEFNIIKKKTNDYFYRITVEVLRAKILYGTNATKKPKFDKKMNFRTFDHALYNSCPERIERSGVEVEDRNSIIEGFGVDLLTLSNILEGKNE